MATRYIEVTSAYRDRVNYPEVAEFIVPFGAESTDPYTSGSYYSPAFPQYEFLSGSQDVGVMVGPPPALAYYTSTDNVNPRCNPTLLSVNSGSYVGYYMQRFDTGEYSLVAGYDAPSATFTLNPPTITPLVTGFLGSRFKLLDLSPVAIPPVVPPASTNLYGACVQRKDIYNRDPLPATEIDIGYYLVYEGSLPGVPESRKITEYLFDKRFVLFESAFTQVGFFTGSRFTVRKSLPVQKNYTLTTTASPSQIVITPVPGFTAKDYEGMLFYVNPLTAATDELFPNTDPTVNKMTFNEYVYIIRKFDPATNTITLDRPINPVMYDAAAPYTPFNGRVYELLPRAVNGSFPLAYSGSLVSQATVACYNVELTNLSLPNVVLTTGSRAVSYPYVYVDFRPDGRDFQQGENLIVSNNPNSQRALFICPVTNIVDPDLSTFIKIDANGMTHSIKFRPNSRFYFRVYLPDGTLFKPLQADNPPPLEPNGLLQIEAIFGFSQ